MQLGLGGLCSKWPYLLSIDQPGCIQDVISANQIEKYLAILNLIWPFHLKHDKEMTRKNILVLFCLTRNRQVKESIKGI